MTGLGDPPHVPREGGPLDQPSQWAHACAGAKETAPALTERLHSELSVEGSDVSPSFDAAVVPAERSMYLGHIANAVRDYHRESEEMGEALSLHAKLEAAAKHLAGDNTAAHAASVESLQLREEIYPCSTWPFPRLYRNPHDETKKKKKMMMMKKKMMKMMKKKKSSSVHDQAKFEGDGTSQE